MSKLAIHGGDPIRTKPFPEWPRPTSELKDAIISTLENEGWGVGSKAISRFEESFADFHDAKLCISTSSGTTALWVALKAAGVKAGDEVIVPPYTFIATASAVLMANAVPIFVDIDENTFNIDPDLIEDAITEKTKVIMPVHIAGNPADMDRILSIGEKHNISKTKSKEIFEMIEKFAQYGFNKSHSTAYAYVAYQTAWLKTYYPAEFMSANLTSEMSNIDRIVILINECRKLKIDVNPPDVNISDINFRPVNKKTISFGLNAIKNVGTKALEQIIETRNKHGEFDSLFDFCANVNLQAVNKRVLESLNMSGAMDGLEGNRAQKYAAIEIALKYGQTIQENKAKNQVDLFGASSNNGQDISIVPTLSMAEEWPESQLLENEKEVLGMYISGHPLLKFAEDLEEFSNFDFSENISNENIEKIRVGGTIADVKMHFDRKNNQMAFFNLDCLGGQAEILAFSDTFAKYKDLIVVSPDVGGVVRARALAKRLDDADLAIIDKRRPMANVAEVMHIIGDVSGKTCIMIDDLVDTAGTLCSAAAALKKQGAVKVVAYCTHPVLSGAAIENLRHSVLNELIVTDTIPLSDEAVKLGKIRQLSVADMLAETIRRIAAGESVSSLYVD